MWDLLRQDYPKTEYHPSIAPAIERFDQKPQARVLTESRVPVGRCWFLSEDSERLVQVQPDRFVLNWRKAKENSAYPSYDTLRELFITELTRFLLFVTNEQLGEFQPNQCELIYENHLRKGDLSDVLVPWSGRAADSFLPAIEDLRLGWHYRFEEDSQPIGRMHVQLRSAMRLTDELPLFVLSLTGRGAPLGSGIDGVLSFTDRAHEWIVRGFTAITTPNMHRNWERQE